MRQVRAVLADQFGVPEREADLARPAAETLALCRKLCVREIRANLPGGLGGHFCRIDSVEIAAGRKGLRVAYRIAAAAGRHVGSSESTKCVADLIRSQGKGRTDLFDSRAERSQGGNRAITGQCPADSVFGSLADLDGTAGVVVVTRRTSENVLTEHRSDHRR